MSEAVQPELDEGVSIREVLRILADRIETPAANIAWVEVRSVGTGEYPCRIHRRDGSDFEAVFISV